MIVEMKKVSLVMLKAEKEEALKKLRSLGVVHLESLEGAGEKLAQLKSDFEQCRNAMGILRSASRRVQSRNRWSAHRWRGRSRWRSRRVSDR